MPLNGLKHFSQVSNSPVRMLAGDALQHGLQRAPAVLHGVGVSDPRRGEGAEGGQVFGVLHAAMVRVEQNHQVFQDVQFIQHRLQRCREDLRSCSRKSGCQFLLRLEQQNKMSASLNGVPLRPLHLCQLCFLPFPSHL